MLLLLRKCVNTRQRVLTVVVFQVQLLLKTVMKMQKSVVQLLIIFGVAMVVSTNAFAQPGKISAKVTDASSGEAMLKAAVKIVETKQGAYTKANGVATIINVAAGTYQVEATFPGYKKQTIKGVKVQSDITSNLEFSLSTTEQKEIVVKADKLIEKSKTEVSTKFDQALIQNLPGKQNVNDIVSLTPGIVKDNSNGGQPSIAGSRGTSNSNKINGIETTDIVSGQTNSLQQNISKFALQEVNVVTSGADASKGGFTGGVIDVTTRGGGTSTSIDLHYRQELGALFGSAGNGYKQMPENDRIYELAVGGPLFGEDIKYFITAKANPKEFDNISEIGESNNGLNVIDPAGNNLGQIPHTSQYRRAITGKLSFDLLGFRASADAQLTSTSSQINGRSFLYTDQAQLPAINNVNNLYTINAKGEIGEGILELLAGFQTIDERYGKYDQSAGGGMFSLYSLYDPKDEYVYDDISHTMTAVPGGDGIIDIYTPAGRQIANPSNPGDPYSLSTAGLNPMTGRIEGPAIYTTANPYGIVVRGAFPSAGNVAGFSYDTRRRIQFEAKYSQQIGEHYIKGGFETQIHNIESSDNSQPWDANPFKDSFAVKPMTGAVYIIDKMEFSDITFNPSLRFDFYDPGNDRVILNPENPIQGGEAQFGSAPLQTQLSPRLGITYAVTEQTTFNFNYGMYFKQPLFTEVLSNVGGNLVRVLQRGNQIIGNGGLKAERTKEIVVGFQTALTDILAMSVQGIYKDMRNLSGLQIINSEFLPIGYTLYSDDQYGNSKSIQLSFDKRMRDNWGLRFNYTLSSAKGTSTSATENYNRLINVAAGSETVVLPLQPFALGFDRPHVAQLILNSAFAKGEGPELFGLKILENFNFAATTEFQSGRPYTRLDLKGNQAGEFNGDRHPAYFQTDATLTRTIPLADLFGESFGSTSFDIQLEILNLFNRTEALRVYDRTGQPDDDGQPGTYASSTVYKNDPTNADGQQIDELGQLRYNARADINNDGVVDLAEQQTSYDRVRKDGFDRRANFQIPRRVFLNLAFKF